MFDVLLFHLVIHVMLPYGISVRPAHVVVLRRGLNVVVHVVGAKLMKIILFRLIGSLRILVNYLPLVLHIIPLIIVVVLALVLLNIIILIATLLSSTAVKIV